MTALEVKLIDHSDVKSILIACKCGVEVRIQLDSRIPEGCNSCGVSFSPGSHHAVQAIMSFVNEAKHEGVQEKVRIWLES